MQKNLLSLSQNGLELPKDNIISKSPKIKQFCLKSTVKRQMNLQLTSHTKVYFS